jgi:predicted acetyltransferase
VFTGDPHDVTEFFIMRKFRRPGVGKRAAAGLFQRYPGRWTVRQQVSNPAATAFWRTAIRYSFEESEHDGEIIQEFRTDR